MGAGLRAPPPPMEVEMPRKNHLREYTVEEIVDGKVCETYKVKAAALELACVDLEPRGKAERGADVLLRVSGAALPVVNAFCANEYFDEDGGSWSWWEANMSVEPDRGTAFGSV